MNITNFLKNLIIPTPDNNYRAYLIKTPVLVFLTIGITVFNTLAGAVPVGAANAFITQQGLLEMHNRERKQQGLAPLKLNTSLSASAQQKAQAMLDADCWSHYCPDGKSPWDFFAAVGYKYYTAGENLAEGFFNNEDVIVAWMNSPTHRANILKQDYEEVGFGIVQGRFQDKENNIIIAVHFGTREAPTVQTANGLENALPTPTITYPQDGLGIRSKDITIEGRAPDATQIQLFRDGAEWVTADANEGIFTYRATDLQERDYSIYVESFIGARRSNPSSTVNFRIDFTSDPIMWTNVIVNDRTEDSIKVIVNQPHLDQLTMSVGAETFTFAKSDQQIWSSTIPLSKLKDQQLIMVTAIDTAGNKWDGSFAVAELIAKANSIPVIRPNEGIGLFGNNILGIQAKAHVNAVFLLALLILFAIDFIVLARSGKTKYIAQSHLHFALLFVVGVIVITGSFGGQIASGLKILNL